MTKLLFLALLASAAMVAGCTTVISEQRLFHPVAAGTLDQKTLTAAAPVFTITRDDVVAPDGARLHAVRLRQPGARVTVLYFGGRSFTIGRFGARISSNFAPLGVDLFIVDHRGYGQSEGNPTAAAMAADGLAIFDHVAALPDLAADRVIVHGHSMGSFLAGYVAAHRPAGGVVLESSVTTTEDWAQTATPLLIKPFIRMRIADDLKGKGNLPNMSLIEESLLILVGEKDKRTPPRLAEALYAASPLPAERKSLAVIPRAGHDDVMTHAEAIAAYRRFLAPSHPRTIAPLKPMTCDKVLRH